MDGIGLPQLYVGFPANSGEPPKQLKACRKVSVLAGDSADIVFELNLRAFSIWSTSTNQWILAGEVFDIMIGHSSRDIVISRKFEFTSEKG